MSSFPWRSGKRSAAWTVAAVLSGLGLIASGAPVKTSSPSPGSAALDFDTLAEQAKDTVAPLTSLKPPLPKVPEELAGAQWSALRLPRGQGYVQPYPLCHAGKECTVGVALAVKKGRGYTVKAKLELPSLPQGAELTNVLPLALLDCDGDGNEELLVRYEGIKRVGGAQTIDWLAIVNIPTMSLALLHELDSWGNSQTDANCGFDVYRLDLNGDGRQDLRFVRECHCPKKVPNCPQSPSVTEEFLATPEHRFTLRPAARPAK